MLGENRRALAIGWHSRNLRYLKELKPLEHYLKPPLTAEQKRDKGARDVKALFQRIAEKGK